VVPHGPLFSLVGPVAAAAERERVVVQSEVFAVFREATVVRVKACSAWLIDQKVVEGGNCHSKVRQ
jgi:hypothetical protein